MAALTLTLPKLDAKPAHPPETRLAKVAAWLADIGRRDPVAAAQLMGDALAATNRVDMTDARRMELAEAYWNAATQLWPRLERTVLAAPHPLTGPPLEAAKAALTLAQELSTAYKHLLAREAGKRISLGGSRLAGALIHRCLQCFARVLASSYQSYSPVPPYTWLDAHAVYAYARARNLHLNAIPGDAAEATPERIYVQALLLALANPYGFHPGQLGTVLVYLQTHSHWAKLTDVAPVHRLAKSVAIVPAGHDFPPFSANKGGAMDGARLYLLTFDLAFQLQEELRALETGGKVPADVGRDVASRQAYIALFAAPAAPMGDPARAPVQPPAVARPGRHVRRVRRGVAVQQGPARRRLAAAAARRPAADDALPGHQPHARGLRAAPDRHDARVAAHRRARVAARRGAPDAAARRRALVPQHAQGHRARVRLRASGRSRRGRRGGRRGRREPGAGAGHRAARGHRGRGTPPQVVVPGRPVPARAGGLAASRAARRHRRADQARRPGPGYEIHEFVPVE
jgi:hypothetical protein